MKPEALYPTRSEDDDPTRLNAPTEKTLWGEPGQTRRFDLDARPPDDKGCPYGIVAVGVGSCWRRQRDGGASTPPRRGGCAKRYRPVGAPLVGARPLGPQGRATTRVAPTGLLRLVWVRAGGVSGTAAPRRRRDGAGASRDIDPFVGAPLVGARPPRTTGAGNHKGCPYRIVAVGVDSCRRCQRDGGASTPPRRGGCVTRHRPVCRGAPCGRPTPSDHRGGQPQGLPLQDCCGWCALPKAICLRTNRDAGLLFPPVCRLRYSGLGCLSRADWAEMENTLANPVSLRSCTRESGLWILTYERWYGFYHELGSSARTQWRHILPLTRNAIGF